MSVHMPVTFTENHYFKVAENGGFSKDESSLSLKTSYGKVSYIKFKENLSDFETESKTWGIPQFFIALIKFIYHTAKAAFSLPSLLSCDTVPLQVQGLNIYRDLEKAFGHVYTLIDPSYGTYLVQKSEFQQTCYEIFLYNHTRQKLKKEFKELEKNYHAGAYQWENLGNRFLSIGDLEGAYKAAEKISLDTHRQDRLYISISEAYLARGDLEKAHKVAKKIFHTNTVSFTSLIIKIAEKYLDQGDYKQAFEKQKTIYWDVNKKIEFCGKICDKATKSNDLDFTLKTVIPYMRSDACEMTFGTAFMNSVRGY